MRSMRLLECTLHCTCLWFLEGYQAKRGKVGNAYVAIGYMKEGYICERHVGYHYPLCVIWESHD